MTKTCQHPACERQANIKGGARGYCGKHYQRFKKHGDSAISKCDRETKFCTVPGCGLRIVSKGLCNKHRSRFLKTGSVNIWRETKIQWIERNSSRDVDDCFSWPYAVSHHGRGMLVIGGVNTSAPRAMCIAAHGPPPSPNHEAAHSCGNGHSGCLNPKHLSWKTRKENEADKIIHGTLRKGCDINTAKLNENQVRDIRRMREEGVPGAFLAQRYGVTNSAISAIVNRKTWAWLE